MTRQCHARCETRDPIPSPSTRWGTRTRKPPRSVRRFCPGTVRRFSSVGLSRFEDGDAQYVPCIGISPARAPLRPCESGRGKSELIVLITPQISIWRRSARPPGKDQEGGIRSEEGSQPCMSREGQRCEEGETQNRLVSRSPSPYTPPPWARLFLEELQTRSASIMGWHLNPACLADHQEFVFSRVSS